MSVRVRRRRQLSAPGRGVRHAPDNMDLLAFKYMEMCHVESSTDSDSEISPRWSDTSTMGCASSAPESGSLGRALPLVHRPAGRYGSSSLFLDPYDGSSEDSESAADVSSRRGKQQQQQQVRGGGGGGGGGCRFSRRSRRALHQPPPSVALREAARSEVRDGADVQMKCGSDCELWVCELHALPAHADPHLAERSDWATHTANMDTESQLYDSGLHATRSPTPDTLGRFSPAGRSSSPSPTSLECLYKRKLGVPGADVLELEEGGQGGQGKRQRVVNMEDEPEDDGLM